MTSTTQTRPAAAAWEAVATPVLLEQARTKRRFTSVDVKEWTAAIPNRPSGFKWEQWMRRLKNAGQVYAGGTLWEPRHRDGARTVTAYTVHEEERRMSYDWKDC